MGFTLWKTSHTAVYGVYHICKESVGSHYWIDRLPVTPLVNHICHGGKETVKWFAVGRFWHSNYSLTSKIFTNAERKTTWKRQHEIHTLTNTREINIPQFGKQILYQRLSNAPGTTSLAAVYYKHRVYVQIADHPASILPTSKTTAWHFGDFLGF